MKEIPKDISNEIYKAVNRLEISTEIIKSIVDYFDINEKELTPSERMLLRRSKEFLGIEQ